MVEAGVPPRHCWRCGVEVAEDAPTCFLCFVPLDPTVAAQLAYAQPYQPVAPRGFQSTGGILSRVLFWLMIAAIPALGGVIWLENRHSSDVGTLLALYAISLGPPVVYAALRGWYDWRKGRGFSHGMAVLRFVLAVVFVYALGFALLVAAVIALFVTCLSSMKR